MWALVSCRCSAETSIRRNHSQKGMWRIRILGKSWNKGLRTRQLWLKSYLTLQSHPKSLSTPLWCDGRLEAYKFKRHVLSLQAAATQLPTAQRQELKTRLLLPSHVTATGSASLTSVTCTLVTFILQSMFLHFAYGMRDYLPFFCSFVNFIDNNMCDSLQSQISFQPSQQHTSSAVQESGSWGLEW